MQKDQVGVHHKENAAAKRVGELYLQQMPDLCVEFRALGSQTLYSQRTTFLSYQ